MTPDQQQEIVRLRNLNLSPKEIARKLNIPPAEVKAVIKAEATTTANLRVERGELPPLKECLINKGAVERLLDHLRRNSKSTATDIENDEAGGLAQIIVTRLDRAQCLVCSYLVDYWCLGIKDTLGPRKMDRMEYDLFVRHAREAFAQEFCEISLEEAQSIIFGSIDFATKCGFKPHPDFEKSRPHLGQPPESLLNIEFGQNGKPYYINGPRDDFEEIVETLRENLGEGNFDCLIHLH